MKYGLEECILLVISYSGKMLNLPKGSYNPVKAGLNLLTFYVYKDRDKSFTLKTCKPKYDGELVELFDFTDKLQRDDEIIEKSIPLFFMWLDDEN